MLFCDEGNDTAEKMILLYSVLIQFEIFSRKIILSVSKYLGKLFCQNYFEIKKL